MDPIEALRKLHKDTENAAFAVQRLADKAMQIARTLRTLEYEQHTNVYRICGGLEVIADALDHQAAEIIQAVLIDLDHQEAEIAQAILTAQEKGEDN